MDPPGSPVLQPRSAASTAMGSPSGIKGQAPVRMDLAPVEVPIQELHYASEAALNGPPLFVRGRCDRTASMGVTKAGAPFYTLTLVSLVEEKSKSGVETGFFHKIRLVAFGDDAPRTCGVLLKDNVVDVIHPRIMRANPQWATDSTVAYELRVAADTQIKVFREDPKNAIAEYTIKEVQTFTADKQSLVSVRGTITKILPFFQSKSEGYGYREIWISDRNGNSIKIALENEVALALAEDKLGKSLHIGPLRPNFYLEQFQGISLETVTHATRIIALEDQAPISGQADAASLRADMPNTSLPPNVTGSTVPGASQLPTSAKPPSQELAASPQPQRAASKSVHIKKEEEEEAKRRKKQCA